MISRVLNYLLLILNGIYSDSIKDFQKCFLLFLKNLIFNQICGRFYIKFIDILTFKTSLSYKFRFIFILFLIIFFFYKNFSLKLQFIGLSNFRRNYFVVILISLRSITILSAFVRKNRYNQKFNIDPQIIQLNSQEQVLKADKRYQVHFVCSELWNFLMKHIKGGPCIPLYTIEIHEIKKSTFHDFTFLSQHDIKELPKGLVIPVDMTQIEFLIQNENDSFTYITKVVPLVFTIEQVINKILSQKFNISNYLCFNQTSKKVILNKTSTLIYELEFRSLWFFKPNQGEIGFSENLDEITMQQDFQNHIPGSTESTIESREIQSILDSSKSHEFEDDTNPNNNSNLMLRDINEFKNEIESILQNHKNQPLILLKEEQAIENINQIILQIDQENCFKKEQQEEGTNDELIDYQDI